MHVFLLDFPDFKPSPLPFPLFTISDSLDITFPPFVPSGNDVIMTCDGSDFALFDGLTDLKESSKSITWFRTVANETEILWQGEIHINGTPIQTKSSPKLQLVDTEEAEDLYKIKIMDVNSDDIGFYWCTIKSYGYTVASDKEQLMVWVENPQIGESVLYGPLKPFAEWKRKIIHYH